MTAKCTNKSPHAKHDKCKGVDSPGKGKPSRSGYSGSSRGSDTVGDIIESIGNAIIWWE